MNNTKFLNMSLIFTNQLLIINQFIVKKKQYKLFCYIGFKLVSVFDKLQFPVKEVNAKLFITQW